MILEGEELLNVKDRTVSVDFERIFCLQNQNKIVFIYMEKSLFIVTIQMWDEELFSSYKSPTIGTDNCLGGFHFRGIQHSVSDKWWRRGQSRLSTISHDLRLIHHPLLGCRSNNDFSIKSRSWPCLEDTNDRTTAG
jgi:hypothetical protein